MLLYVVHVMQVQGAPPHCEFIIEHEDLISQAQHRGLNSKKINDINNNATTFSIRQLSLVIS